MTDDRTPYAGAGHRFMTTRWSLVLGARPAGNESSADALAALCERYWHPLYAYVRRRGHDAEDARDLTQAFFAHLLEKDAIGKADPERGRFRTFLLSSMQNFVTQQWRRDRARKRGGDLQILSFDFDAAEADYARGPADEMDPEAVYLRKWALGLIERAVVELGAEYADRGQEPLFEAIKGAIGGGEEALSYPELSAALAMSEGSLRTAVSRLRSRWRDRLRSLVAETVADESAVKDELGCLLAALDGGL